MSHDPTSIAAALVADGKGILAADETIPTLTKRFDALGIGSTAESRRVYREMLFAAPGAASFISGVIMHDETIRQKNSAGVTAWVLHAVFDALFAQQISLEAMLLKPNMIIAGKECPRAASVQDVATATLRCLRRHVPAAVPGVVFLSGGQSDRVATANLNAINRLPGPRPWKVSFSYGRALQDPALAAWHGQAENLIAGQQALSLRARCNGAASRGTYTEEMETTPTGTGSPVPRRE